jgi:hypothetical protein
MQALPPATSNAPLLRGKPWRWALLSAALTLGVSAACPGAAEAGGPSKKSSPPIFSSPPATIGASATQLSANLQIDPANAARSSSKSGKFTAASVASSGSSKSGKNDNQGKGGKGKTLSIPAYQDMDPQAAMTQARVLTLSKKGKAFVTSQDVANGSLTAAPAPLPLLGAGVAFAYSRKVRRRVSQATSEELIPAFACS